MAASVYGMYGSVGRADILVCLPKLRAFARVLSADRDRADRLVQDAIGQVWQAAKPDPVAPGLAARLYRILHELHHTETAASASTVAPFGDLSNDGFPTAFWELAGHHRELLVLEGVMQLSRAEIAMVSGWPLEMVEVLLCQARTALWWTMTADPIAGAPMSTGSRAEA
jgi:RNA polymerase sigma-70 factor (ECF subfamily)